MKKLLLVLALLFFACSAFCSEIASINLKTIDNTLQDYVLSMEKYADLKKEMSEAEGETEQLMKKMKTEEGKISFDLKDTSKGLKKYKMKKQLQDIMKRELVILMTELNLKFKLIYNSSEQDAIIYSEAKIIDITQDVYQEIVKRLKSKK
ncbi:hypothetical protein ACFL27_20780 [candidate division CSSED10-310 bacterium]|uniref:OmpH family outer membrane protein n=1 Tax=candidate division CSSED10-310 bacterium TaxID=2855610 RepID=A0ABV6Z2H7_UNCC1